MVSRSRLGEFRRSGLGIAELGALWRGEAVEVSPGEIWCGEVGCGRAGPDGQGEAGFGGEGRGQVWRSRCV